MTRQVASRSNRILLALLIATLCLAFGLRLSYFFNSNRIVDEYISMLSMRAVRDEGAPILPSGRFYGPKGLLHTYLGALSAILFGWSDLSLSFQSIVAGSMAVAYLYRTGSDWFGPAVGLSAAAALACAPTAVQWGGRVRMYSLWQLLALVAVHLLINGCQTRPRLWSRLAGAAALALALLTHTLTLFLLGGLVAAVALERLASPGKKTSIHLSIWDLIAALLLVAVILALNPLAGPWGGQVKMSDVTRGTLTLQTIQERALYLLTFTRQFVTAPLWPLSFFYAVGFVRLFLRFIRRSPIPGDREALTLYLLAFSIWFGVAIFAHVYRERYLFVIIPFFLLLALRELCLSLRILSGAIRPSPGLWHGLTRAGAATLAAVALLTPAAAGKIRAQSADLAAAYGYVRANWQPGDAVAACHPAPSQWLLERADYYAIEFAAGVQDGIDVWTGAPLLDTPEAFAAAVDAHDRTWYVADALCWESYLTEELRHFVRWRMTLVASPDGVDVFLSEADGDV